MKTIIFYETKLSLVEQEKDLVFTTNKLKFRVNVQAASDKAMVLLGGILRISISITSSNYMYTTCIRSHLAYCIRAWSPYLAKDIACLKKVQRRATILVTGVKNKPYSESLSLLGLIKER